MDLDTRQVKKNFFFGSVRDMDTLPVDILNEYFGGTNVHKCSRHYFVNMPRFFATRVTWKCDFVRTCDFQMFLFVWLHVMMNTFAGNRIAAACETNVLKTVVLTGMFSIVNYGFALMTLIFFIGLKCVVEQGDILLLYCVCVLFFDLLCLDIHEPVFCSPMWSPIRALGLFVLVIVVLSCCLIENYLNIRVFGIRCRLRRIILI